MSLRQDRLTFFGVLVAVVIAVVGYLQLGTMYPLEGRADESQATRGEKSADSEQSDVGALTTSEGEKNKHNPVLHDSAERQEDAVP